MKKIYYLLFIIITAISFFLGMKWQQNIYEDICLDLGGGRNPDGYPICVKEIYPETKKTVYKDNESKIEIESFEQEFAKIKVSGKKIDSLEFHALLSPTGSGVKYVSALEKYFVWSKGNECMFMENDSIKLKISSK